MSDLKQDFSGLKVLVAEDEAMAGKLVRGALRISGINDVVYCKDGAQAVKALDAAPGTFQLVISDWNMPTVSGLDLLRYVRMHHGGTKFVMLTSRLEPDAVLKAKGLGVDGYIAKPFSPQTLKKKVQSLFQV